MSWLHCERKAVRGVGPLQTRVVVVIPSRGTAPPPQIAYGGEDALHCSRDSVDHAAFALTGHTCASFVSGNTRK